MSDKCSCSPESTGKCTEPKCSNYDEFHNLLHNCPRKTIANTADCPSIRSCPNCKEAIEHTEACNNMECRSCNKHFCFICLKLANAGGSLMCSAPHTVAPIQSV